MEFALQKGIEMLKQIYKAGVPSTRWIMWFLVAIGTFYAEVFSKRSICHVFSVYRFLRWYEGSSSDFSTVSLPHL